MDFRDSEWNPYAVAVVDLFRVLWTLFMVVTGAVYRGVKQHREDTRDTIDERDDEHVDVVPDGSGCVETCEVLSDHREDRDDNDPGRGVE